jgi:hypothetical protein
VESDAHEPLQQFSPEAQSLFWAQVAEPAPHWFAVPPPPQLSPEGQVPQESWPPHPSGSEPQVALESRQVVGTQVDPLLLELLDVLVVHWFASQVWPAAQAPQVSCPPQPSEMAPQVARVAAQVVGTHVDPLELLELLELVDGFAQAPPRQASGEVQSASERHDAPHTLVDAHDSPDGQAELEEQTTGAMSEPIGTLLDVEHAAAAISATKAPSGRPDRNSEAGRAFIGAPGGRAAAGAARLEGKRARRRVVSSPWWPAISRGVKKSSRVRKGLVCPGRFTLRSRP